MFSPHIVLCHHSWHLLTRCWERHPWQCCQDRTPLLPMPQQMPSQLGLHTCFSPVSAKGLFPHQERWQTVNTKPADSCSTLQVHAKQRELRLLEDMDHKPRLSQKHLLSYSLSATPSWAHTVNPCSLPARQHPVLPGRAETWPGWAAPKPWVLLQPLKWAPQLQMPAAGRGGGPVASTQHRAWNTNPGMCPPWHPKQPAPRRSHLRGIFWCIFSFCQKHKNKSKGNSTCEPPACLCSTPLCRGLLFLQCQLCCNDAESRLCLMSCSGSSFLGGNFNFWKKLNIFALSHI